MINSSPISLSEIRLKNLHNLLSVLVKGFESRGMDYFLIGAIARDLQMTGKYNYRSPRATHDIDIAVFTNSEQDYLELLAWMRNNQSFTPTSEPYRLRYKDGNLVDFLPFGKIETDQRTVKIHAKEVLEFFAIGLKENLKFAEVLTLDDGLEIKVTSLCGICLLKLLAWNEEPLERDKDVKDFLFILDKYALIYQDEIFESSPDLLDYGWPRGCWAGTWQKF